MKENIFLQKSDRTLARIRVGELELDKADIDQQKRKAEEQVKLPDISILEGMKINKGGNVVDDDGNPIGKVKSGDIKKLIGKTPDKTGKVWDNQGNVIGATVDRGDGGAAQVFTAKNNIRNEPRPREDRMNDSATNLTELPPAYASLRPRNP